MKDFCFFEKKISVALKNPFIKLRKKCCKFYQRIKWASSKATNK